MIPPPPRSFASAPKPVERTQIQLPPSTHNLAELLESDGEIDPTKSIDENRRDDDNLDKSSRRRRNDRSRDRSQEKREKRRSDRRRSRSPNYRDRDDVRDRDRDRYKDKRVREGREKDYERNSRRDRSRSRDRHRDDQGRERRRTRDRSRDDYRDSYRERSSRSSNYDRYSRRSRSRSRSYDRYSRRDRSRSYDRKSSSRSGKDSSGNTLLDTGISIIIDCKGDPDNISYGGNDDSNVPRYNRHGYGNVIGYAGDEKISMESKHRKVLVIENRLNRKRKQPTVRYSDSVYAWKDIDNSTKRSIIKTKASSEEADFSKGQNFISLGDKQKKERRLDETGEDGLLTSGVDYRDIRGDKHLGKSLETDEGEDGEIVDEELFTEQMRRRTIEFNNKLRDDPHDVKTWLEFIKFQDDIASGLNTGVEASTRTKSNKSSINEVKMSIFEKAMENNPDNEELVDAYLKCGGETWDTLTLLREWDNVLKKNPESVKLWADYINLRQTNFASFSFTECVKVFEDCITTLNRILKKLHANRNLEENSSSRESIESILVYIVLRACLFMKQSGYQEKAFGTLQALVEFNLFQPQIFDMSLDITFEKMVQEICDFWDSEVPRFGENNAKGWKEFYRARYNEEDTGTVPDPEKEEDEEEELSSIQDWISAENKADQRHRLALRMNTVNPERVDEDPYIVILSDDIRNFLFNITTRGARLGLIYSIFVFLGLPYTPPGVGTNTHFFTDTFTHNEMKLHNIWPDLEQKPMLVYCLDGVPMEPDHIVTNRDPYGLPISYPVGISELFARPKHWFGCAGRSQLECDADVEFTRNSFKQLVEVEKDYHLKLYHLSFESSCGYKGGRTLAKNMLKENRTNLVLWNAYAQLEKSHDKPQEARKVYQTTLSAYHTFPSSDQEDIPLVYCMFSQLEIEYDNHDEALNILVAMGNQQPYQPNGDKPSSTQLLRAKEFFSQKTMQLSTLSDSDKEDRIAHSYNVCYALFEYLTFGLESACAVYEQALLYIKEHQAERGYASETMWMAYAELLYRHATRGYGGHKPIILREAMERALQLFPNNTLFLGLFIWNEARTRIHNRVRNFFGLALDKDPNVILWVSAIHRELHNHFPYDINLVRSLFDRAVESPSTRSSIVLWKLYIQHEISRDNHEKARTLFYRAVRECPWSKDLYLMGLDILAKDESEKELNEAVSLMMEKEIRIRKQIEDELLV
ncbi:NRDE-2, necessary for RNA interference-domain-containing protein [Phycomyces blakesleeanus]|uniref:NRDE-2, necessary for RNA interference-domain-containing protein n=1 Tax=Phycomyces blakesleeanus TaxID=4837 RepID=A0ABR3AIK5_PHYBL